MRIGIYSNNYLPIISGLTTSIENFRIGLAAKGHRVFVFAPHFPGYCDKNPDVFRYPSFNFRYRVDYPIAINILGWRTRKIADNLKLDIVHSQHPNILGAEAQRTARRNNIPIIFTYHTFYEYYVHYIPLVPRSLVTYFARTQPIDYANKCDAVVAPSESLRKILIQRGLKVPCWVIPSGVDIDKFQKADGKEIREKLKLKAGEVLLMSLCRISSEKNIILLLDAVELILHRNESVRFLLVGGGHQEDEVRQKIKKSSVANRIEFLGAVPMDEVPKYYKAADLFIYASLTETQGMVVTEAMSAGLPIVAVGAGGIYEAVHSGKNGYLTENDAVKLSRKTLELIEDEGKRRAFSRESLKISQNFSIEKTSSKMICLYEKVIKDYGQNRRKY